MKSPILMKVQRAKSVILYGQHLFLKECAKCGSDFYGTEKQTLRRVREKEEKAVLLKCAIERVLV